MNTIPTDLNDAINILMHELPENELVKLKNGSIEEFHHNLGRCIRNNWKLWNNSKLAQWFAANHDVRHADDVSGIVLTSLQRVLKNEDIRLDEQIQTCKEYWANQTPVGKNQCHITT